MNKLITGALLSTLSALIISSSQAATRTYEDDKHCVIDTSLDYYDKLKKIEQCLINHNIKNYRIISWPDGIITYTGRKANNEFIDGEIHITDPNNIGSIRSEPSDEHQYYAAQ